MKINEISARAPEFVELYNDGPDTLSVSEWFVTLALRGSRFGLTGIIPPGGFQVSYMRDVFPFEASMMNDAGGTVALWMPNWSQLSDVVAYGFLGGAPVGPGGTIGRYPDGHDTNDDARDFEFVRLPDAMGTPGLPNAPATPALGSDLLLNEIKWMSDGVPNSQAIEIYNPTGLDMNLAGYWVSDGDVVCPIGAGVIVPTRGVRVLRQGVSGDGLDCGGATLMDIVGSDVVYLYRPPASGEIFPVRIDQLGFVGPLAYDDPTLTFQRCVDGEGPSDGYDYLSCGGGQTYFLGRATLGSTNNGLCTVQNRTTTWGRLKGLYR